MSKFLWKSWLEKTKSQYAGKSPRPGDTANAASMRDYTDSADVTSGGSGTGTGDFKADGTVPMTGVLQAGGNKVTGLGTPTAPTDAVTKAYVDALPVGGDLKSDGTVSMAANFDAGTNKLINVVDPTADQDAATKKYVDDSLPVAANTTTVGIVELATNAEAITGTDTARAMTPSGVQAKLNDYTIDEDDMASDSDVKVPTQQSVKAYVDNATTEMVGSSSSTNGEGGLVPQPLVGEHNLALNGAGDYQAPVPFFNPGIQYTSNNVVTDGVQIYRTTSTPTLGSFIRSEWDVISGNNFKFVSDGVDVTPATPGAPTEAEIKAYTDVTGDRDAVLYYTGNTTETDPATYMFIVDSSGEVRVSKEPVNSATVIEHYTSGQAEIWATGLGVVFTVNATTGEMEFAMPADVEVLHYTITAASTDGDAGGEVFLKFNRTGVRNHSTSMADIRIPNMFIMANDSVPSRANPIPIADIDGDGTGGNSVIMGVSEIGGGDGSDSEFRLVDFAQSPNNIIVGSFGSF